MTAKQKQNIARFKRVVAEAKKLRKKNPKLTQPQAVKQAWAILYKGGKKVGATKIIEKGEKKNAKVTKVLQRVRSKKGTFKGIKRVAGSTHKDTKSHNVNIRVVSGVDNHLIDKYKQVIQEIENYKNSIDRIKNNINQMSVPEKIRAKMVIKTYNEIIRSLKKHKSNIKRNL